MTGKSCLQEPEVDGHIAANLICLFIESRTPAQGTVPPTLRVGLLKLLHPIWKLSHRHAERFISQVLLDPVQLIVLTSTSGTVCQELIVTMATAANIITMVPRSPRAKTCDKVL